MRPQDRRLPIARSSRRRALAQLNDGDAVKQPGLRAPASRPRRLPAAQGEADAVAVLSVLGPFRARVGQTRAAAAAAAGALVRRLGRDAGRARARRRVCRDDVVGTAFPVLMAMLIYDTYVML